MTAREYFVTENHNCSETVIKLANDKYNLGITDNDLKLLSAFGGGMGCGGICGCLAACEAVLGKMFCQEKAHATEGFKDITGNFARKFEQEFGGIDCKDLKSQYAQKDVRCLTLVEKSLDLLDEYIKSLK